MKRSGRRFNSAHVMSAMALFIALGGTSWAAVQVSGDGGHKVTQAAKKKKKKAKPGPQGPQGPAGTARAFARVPANCAAIGSDCTPLKSKGITRITHVAAGNYCIAATGISTTTTPAALTIDFTSTSGPESVPAATLANSASGCPDPVNDFQVFTERPTAFNSDTAVDNVGFTIIIP